MSAVCLILLLEGEPWSVASIFLHCRSHP